MNDGLIDAFRHNAWATDQVLAACRELSDEQLNSEVAGTFGSTISMLRHIIGSEGSYYRRLSGETPDWYSDAIETAGIDELASHAADMAGRWARLLETPFDAEHIHVVQWDGGIQRDVPSGVILTQALHHSNEHRTQICTTLTQIGAACPQLGVWEFAEDTNRAPVHSE
ncbi:MAG: DinB family protein [Thermomicrobiales bacterium]|nr:DinB family protein [Thermomicrobiales bacterium]